MKFVPRTRVAPDVVLDGLTTAIVCLDVRLAVASINSAGESLFEVSRRHSVGEPLAQAIPLFGGCIERLYRALDSGTGFIDREMTLHQSGERPITLDCTVTPILLGKSTGLVMECLALDRHLRISRDELMLAQHQASRELIRGLAHEIKNPLGGIRGAAQLLEQDFPDNTHREYPA